MDIISIKSITVKMEGNKLVVEKKDYFKFIVRPEFIISILATFFRIFLSLKLSVWYYSYELLDDQLLINYASLSTHFNVQNVWSLVKTMGFSVFLNFVHFTGLSYSMAMALIWIGTSILLVRVFQLITKDRIFLTFVYLFTLFTPAAFDNWVGTRLYRNALIAPFVLITFSLMVLIILKLVKNKEITVKGFILSNLMLGFVFSFTYYLKEDGIWLLPCLILSVIISLGIVVYRYIKNPKKKSVREYTLSLIILLVLPILLFIVSTNVYKLINYHYFEVYEINTRTGGAFGEFVNNVYKIQSDNRNIDIWAPKDTIEKAFDASETLREYPELKNEIYHSPWLQGDINEVPIQGDFLSWVLRSALIDTGIWENEAQIDSLFKQINNEMDAAFKNNRLEKDEKFQLTASAGGRSVKEIFQLFDVIVREYGTALLLIGYEPGGQLGEYGNQESYAFATMLINEKIRMPDYDSYRVVEYKMENGMVEVIFKIYSLLNPFLFILAMFSATYMGWQLIIKRRFFLGTKNPIYLCSVLLIFVFLGISFVYAFAIGWFVEFLLKGTEFDWTLLKFYSVGLVPVLILIELLGAFLFLEIYKGNGRLIRMNEKPNEARLKRLKKR